MTPFAWLLGFVLPACGLSGAHGLPIPPAFDIARIVRPASPNAALAAPSGFMPRPDLITPDYAVAPTVLFDTVLAVAAAQPRVFIAAENAARLQAQYVARSRLLNFPDLVSVQVTAGKTGGSELVLYSRSVYGYSDWGVNRERLRAWLAAIGAAIGPSTR